MAVLCFDIAVLLP